MINPNHNLLNHRNLKAIFKVISQSDATSVQKQDGTTLNKSTLILQEFGTKFENSYVCTLLGNAAICTFHPDELVYAALRFTHKEHNGNVYQDITVQDIVKVK